MTDRERERPLEAVGWAEGAHAAGYLLERCLGRGAHAEVFCGLEEETGRRVALKLPFRGDGKARVWRRRFVEELELSRRLQHPNLVEILEVRALPDGWPVLVMEYVRGVTLHHVLESQAPLSLRHVAGLAMTVSQALHHLHQAGVAHCDVSPGNIMFTRTPKGELTFKLLDLGMAGEVRGSAGAGTPLHMAPEQLYHGAVEPSDVYSLGTVLWWALTGAHWRQLQPGERGVVLSQPNAAALDLRRARPEVPGAIAQLVQRMLADAVDVRPRPQQIHQVMHHWLRELPRDDAQARPLRREGAAPPPRETLPGAPKPLRARPQEPQERPQEPQPLAPPRLMVLRVSSADAGAWRGALEAAQSALSGGMAVELYLDAVALRGLARAGAEGARAAWPVRRHGALWARPAARPRPDGALRARLAALLEGGARAFVLADAPPASLPPGVAAAPLARWTERVAEATVHLIFAR